MARVELTKQEAETILGLQGSYTTESVKKLYRELVRTQHPDIVAAHGGDKDAANAKMAEINAAYNYINKYLKRNGGTATTDSSAYTYTPPTSTYTYTPPTSTSEASNKTDEDFRTAAAEAEAWKTRTQTYSPAADFNEPVEEEEPKREGPVFYRFIRAILAHFPYRPALFFLAGFLFTVSYYGTYDIPFLGTAETNPEGLFITMTFFLASFINLFIGTITFPLRRSLLWGWDKLFGRAPKEPNLRYAIFGHLPYRLMFMGFAIWKYWDYATYHVAGSSPFEWPLLVLLFLVSGFNMLLPLITDFIRKLLAGDDLWDVLYDPDDL